MRNRIALLMGLIALLTLVMLSCTLSRSSLSGITPTPTKTKRPLFTATLTPTASSTPTDTPIPSPTNTPTDTPIPPTPIIVLATDTLAPPTATTIPLTDTVASPTATVVPPTDTSVPASTNTPRPAATNTPAPPTATTAPKSQMDFIIKEIYAFEDGSLTSTGFHNIYFTVVDAGGAPIDGIILEEVNNPPPIQVVSGDKGPGMAEFTMYAGDYRFKVASNTSGQTFSSETTHVLSIVFEHADWNDLIRGGICADEASCRALGPMHFSYNVTFQRTR